MMQIHTEQEASFYRKCNERYGIGWFDFSRVNYTSRGGLITVTCQRHQYTFQTRPRNFLRSNVNPCSHCVLDNRNLLAKKGKGVVLADPLERTAHKAFKRRIKSVYRGH